MSADEKACRELAAFIERRHKRLADRERCASATPSQGRSTLPAKPTGFGAAAPNAAGSTVRIKVVVDLTGEDAAAPHQPGKTVVEIDLEEVDEGRPQPPRKRARPGAMDEEEAADAPASPGFTPAAAILREWPRKAGAKSSAKVPRRNPAQQPAVSGHESDIEDIDDD